MTILDRDDMYLIKQFVTPSPYSEINLDVDYERLQQKYKAVVTLAGSVSDLYWDMYGWDCDSIVVLDPDVIEVLPNYKGFDTI